MGIKRLAQAGVRRQRWRVDPLHRHVSPSGAGPQPGVNPRVSIPPDKKKREALGPPVKTGRSRRTMLWRAQPTAARILMQYLRYGNLSH
ncbi:hypothetical protein GCM10011394_01430 [Luteimonas terricola]|uniref:Uncharacterized protein n=1 Tax=Luteimonas terricola TaxID=645597 RepID=A0ABQ2E7V3_9GAMM|nr:hypothetical protein GCM10011394_01430 [Luteimonas terricola]